MEWKQLIWSEIVSLLTFLFGFVYLVMRIIKHIKEGKSAEHDEKLEKLKMDNEQDKKISELDIRITSLEHNLGRLEGMITSMDTRVSASLKDMADKLESSTKEMIKILIDNNKKISE